VIRIRGSNLGRGTFFFPQSAALLDLPVLKMALEVQQTSYSSKHLPESKDFLSELVCLLHFIKMQDLLGQQVTCFHNKPFFCVKGVALTRMESCRYNFNIDCICIL